MGSKKIRLVTRGDDIGSFHSANRAVLEACKTGILRNISVMACTPYVDEAYSLFKEMPSVCTGIHLAINSEWNVARWKPVLPAADVPSLVGEDGCFLQNPGLNHKRGVVFAEIMAELQAQLDALRKIGFNVLYADTHMGFDWLFEKDDSDRLEGHIRRWIETEGLIYTGALNGIGWLTESPSGGIDRVARLIHSLQTIQEGTYQIEAHPAYDDEEMGRASTERTNLGRERDWERRLFCDPRIVRYCHENNIELITYVQAAQGLR